MARRKKKVKRSQAKSGSVHVAQEVHVNVQGAGAGNEADKALTRLTRPIKGG